MKVEVIYTENNKERFIITDDDLKDIDNGKNNGRRNNKVF